MAAQTDSRNPSARRGPSADRGGPRWAAFVLLVAGPPIGAVLGAAAGAHVGAVYTLTCVGSAAAAAVLVSPAGLWWVVPTPPPVVWTVSVLTELLRRRPSYQGSDERAVVVAHGTIHAFPVMAGVELALTVVVGGRLLSARARRSARV